MSRSTTKYSQVPLTVKMEVKRGEYLDFVELGEVLNELAYKEATFDFGKRNVPSRLVEEGKINLLATDTGKTWTSDHQYEYNYPSIYMESTFIFVYG